MFLSLLISCDPEHCRDCETFNFEISNWNIKDDTIATELKFVNQDFVKKTFDFIKINSSEPYTECQLAGSVESVSCYLTRKLEYESASLGFKIIMFYEQIDVPSGNAAHNTCNYIIEYKNEDEHLMTPPIDIWQGVENTISRLIPVSEYTLANIQYNDVYKMKVDQMLVFETYGKIDAERVDSKILEVIFQIPDGIIGLKLESGEQLIIEK